MLMIDQSDTLKDRKGEDFAFQVSFFSNHCKLILRANACCSLPGAPKIYEPAEWETVKGKAECRLVR
jgi:hypothetical protein